ncbi:MAG: GNAT family N-acetyltransferase [Gemmatimonadaceae bacterium]
MQTRPTGPRDPQMPTIEHDADGAKFFAALPEGEAYLSYEELDGRVLDLLHTIVPSRAQRHGVGASLVRAALDYARENDYRIVPSCPFVRAWLAEHPEARDLVASDY